MKRNLKRTLIAIIGTMTLIGLFFGGFSIIGNQIDFVPSAKAEDPKAGLTPPQFPCSNGSLAGRYAVLGVGFAPNGPPPAPLQPFADVSLMTLDGAGNLTNKITVSRNGQITRNLDSGTYSVNPDCTGTLTINVPNAPFPLTFDLVVADLQGPMAREFYFIATTPSVVTHTAKRIQ